MNDEILKKLAAGLDRRSFLRGSSLGVAALLGVAAASPLVVFAQAPQDDKKKADDKVYNTSVQFVDVGSVPEYSCQFIFRVPQGTKLKSFAIESATFDLTALDK